MLNSPLHLECVVQQSPVDPVYIFWYHDSRMINYDSDRGVNVTSDLPNKHSALYIERASRAHSGNYTCAPSNAFPANTVIHILNGKYDYNRLHQGTIEARVSYLTTNIHHTNCENFLRFGWIIYSVIGFFLSLFYLSELSLKNGYYDYRRFFNFIGFLFFYKLKTGKKLNFVLQWNKYNRIGTSES